MISNVAREGAQATWNARACGEEEGDRDSLAYFDAVAARRYADHPWMRDYFRYADYRGKRVLEIGIGQGTDLVSFAQGGAVCHGVDITDNHLRLTEKNFALRGLPVSLHRADAVQLPFPDDHFDCVYSMGVLHHIPEIETVLAEIRRVLRPGGTLLVSVYNKWSAFHIFRKVLADGIRSGALFRMGYAGLLATIEERADGIRIKPYVKLYTPSSLTRLLKGFEIEDVSVRHLDGRHFWPDFVGRALDRYARLLEPRLGWYVNVKARLTKEPSLG